MLYRPLQALVVVLAVVVRNISAEEASGRMLKAAALHSDIAKRSFEVPIRKQLRLHYIEDDLFATEHMGANVELYGKWHSLLLEELDHMLEEVHCEADSLHLKFAAQHFSNAKAKLDAHSELIIITSHYGCNEAGSRLPYRVFEKSYSDSECSALFSLSSASWKKDFKLHVNFGPEDGQKYSINKHDHLRRRSVNVRGVVDAVESALPGFGTTTVSETATVTGSDKVSFPAATETALVNRTAITEDIGRSFKATQIFPPKVDGIKINNPALTKTGVTITCKDCTTSGKVRLASGSFSSDPDPGASDFISDGFASIVANELAATMVFDTHWTPAVAVPINITLPEIPLSPIAIPGVANIGLTFTPHIILGATVSSTLDFSYGFNASVPSNSTAIANFGSPTNSSAKGFDQTTITPLPFNAGVPSIAAVKLTAILQPEISLGVTVLDQLLGAALFINMPQLAATIEGVNGTMSNCDSANTLTNGTSATEAQDEANQVAELLGSLVHIQPDVELAAGFVLEAGDVVQTAWTPLATQFAVPTGCFAFDKDKKGFTPATEAFASATSAAAEQTKAAKASKTGAGAAASTSADSGAGALVSERVAETGGLRWRVTAVALGVVFGGFLVM